MQDLCALIYASYALKRVFTQTGVLKKRMYKIQSELVHKVRKTKPNKNDVFYSLIFENELEFILNKDKPPDKDNLHKLNMRIVCNLIRGMPEETGEPQTMLNLATCFLLGNFEKMKCPLSKASKSNPHS